MRKVGWLTLAVAALAACGGDSGGGASSGPEAFIGTWNATGQVQVSATTLLGPLNTSLPASGMATIASGSQPDQITISQENGCTVSAKVVADQATVADGTSCTVNGSGTTMTITFHQGTLAVQNASTLSLSASGDAIGTSSGPLGPSSGTFTWTSTLARTSP